MSSQVIIHNPHKYVKIFMILKEKRKRKKKLQKMIGLAVFKLNS